MQLWKKFDKYKFDFDDKNNNKIIQGLLTL